MACFKSVALCKKLRRLGYIAPVLIVFLLLAGLVYLRVQAVERSIGSYIACSGCFDFPVMKADLVIFGITAGLFLAGSLLRPTCLARVAQLLVGGLILVYVADLIVFRLFNSRLFLSDASLFVSEYAAVWDQFSSGVGGLAPAIAMLLGLVLVFALLWWAPPQRNLPARLALATLVVMPLLFGALTEDPSYVNSWAVDNVFAANLASSERVLYSDEEAARLREPQAPSRELRGEAAGRGRNVVVVLLESWSQWHSRLFGGFENWTPELDAAAERGLRFSNLHSIGFSTDKGLVGILAGQPLWAPFLHGFETSPFHSMWGVRPTLASVFNAAGYHTAFLTSGPLDLYRKGEWLRDLGFAEVEGNEHAFYASLPRYAFGAASDRALYQRAEAWRTDASAPYLLVIETVTTHQPYTDPDSGENSLQKAMRHADRAFGEYLLALDESGFFANGVLLVVSDHRSMTPIWASEVAAFGADAHSRVPAFVIGEGFVSGVDQRVYSQADLVPGFQFWLSGEVELSALGTLMLEQQQARNASERAGNCAFHLRGDERGLVEVICQDGRGQVRLKGDRTAFTSQQGLDAAEQAAILDRIGALRLQALARHEQDGNSGLHR